MDLWFDPEHQVIVDRNEQRKYYAYTIWLHSPLNWFVPRRANGPVV